MFEEELTFLQKLFVKQTNGEEITPDDRNSYYIISAVLEENGIYNPFTLEF